MGLLHCHSGGCSCGAPEVQRPPVQCSGATGGGLLGLGLLLVPRRGVVSAWHLEAQRPMMSPKRTIGDWARFLGANGLEGAHGFVPVFAYSSLFCVNFFGFFFFGFCLLRSAHLSAFILADGDWLLRVVLDVVSSMRCRAVSEPQPLPGTPRAGWR